MNVRGLIANLLDFDMDAEVEIRVDSKENADSTSDFELHEEGHYSGHKYLTLSVEVKNQVLVDESEFNNLKDEVTELTNTVESLEVQLEDAERLVTELEGE